MGQRGSCHVSQKERERERERKRERKKERERDHKKKISKERKKEDSERKNVRYNNIICGHLLVFCELRTPKAIAGRIQAK